MKPKSDWDLVLDKVQQDFGMPADLQSVLYLIGVQELGKGYRKFSKDDKLNILHIAICTLLEPYGFYVFAGHDKDGWPHWDVKEELPLLTASEQNNLMIRACIDYFKSNGYLEPEK